jgi:hypothetical protein
MVKNNLFMDCAQKKEPPVSLRCRRFGGVKDAAPSHGRDMCGNQLI